MINKIYSYYLNHNCNFPIYIHFIFMNISNTNKNKARKMSNLKVSFSQQVQRHQRRFLVIETVSQYIQVNLVNKSFTSFTQSLSMALDCARLIVQNVQNVGRDDFIIYYLYFFYRFSLFIYFNMLYICTYLYTIFTSFFLFK